MGEFVIPLRRSPLGSLPPIKSGRPSTVGISAALKLELDPQPDWVVLRRRLEKGPRDFAAVARYDEIDLPLDELNIIGEDTLMVFGWLASRAFWVWQQAVAAGNPRATTLHAYRNFPAPALTKKDREVLEEAARTVLVSRSHLMGEGLQALYESPPEQLLWAHDELDRVVDHLMGIPEDADDAQAARCLLKSYELLAA